MTKVLSIDFETYYNSKIGYGIRELGVQAYLADEKFDPYMISVFDGKDSWAGEPKNFNWQAAAQTADILVAHNAGFDSAVYKEMVQRGLAPGAFLRKPWHCTANMSSYICGRRSLVDACDFLLNVRLNKATRDYANGKTWLDIQADGKAEEMLAYARSDALHCWQLWDKFSAQWPKHERRLSELTIRQGEAGVAIDETLLDEYLELAGKYLALAEARIPWIVEGRAPTSPIAMSQACRREGIPCPPVKSREGAEAFDKWEEEYAPKFPWVKAVSDWRQIHKFKDSLETVGARVRPDGTFPFALKYFGAHTGRWSGDSGFNMQNLRKKPLYFTDAGHLSESPGPVALDVRRLIVPRPGYRMVTADLCQIEARVLPWLTGDKPLLVLIAGGMSVYEAHARTTMGWTGGPLKDEDPDLYQLAKIRVLALGFGAGWLKLITIAQNFGLDITKNDPETCIKQDFDGNDMYDEEDNPIMIPGYGQTARKIVRDFRKQSPGIVALWQKLDERFKNSVGHDFKMTLPSGRVMCYREVMSEFRMVQDPETKKYKQKKVFTADIGGQRYVLYGGLLTENLVQATAREVFAAQLLALDIEPGAQVLFSCHDEAVCEISPGVSTSRIEQIMSTGPAWTAGLPLAADVHEVTSYRK